MAEGDGAELEAAAKEAAPAQADRERLGAQKIFVAETRIFADRDGAGLERGASPQTEAITTDFDGAAEGSVEAGGDFVIEDGVLDRE